MIKNLLILLIFSLFVSGNLHALLRDRNGNIHQTSVSAAAANKSSEETKQSGARRERGEDDDDQEEEISKKILNIDRVISDFKENDDFMDTLRGILNDKQAHGRLTRERNARESLAFMVTEYARQSDIQIQDSTVNNLVTEIIEHYRNSQNHRGRSPGPSIPSRSQFNQEPPDQNAWSLFRTNSDISSNSEGDSNAVHAELGGDTFVLPENGGGERTPILTGNSETQSEQGTFVLLTDSDSESSQGTMIFVENGENEGDVGNKTCSSCSTLVINE